MLNIDNEKILMFPNSRLDKLVLILKNNTVNPYFCMPFIL